MLINYWTKLSVKHKALLWLVQFVVVLSLLGVNHNKQPLKLNANLTSLFADKTQQQLERIAVQFDQQTTNKQIVLVSAKSFELAVSKADELAQQLSQLPLVDYAKARF